jgi:hypothetical protein
VSSTEIETDPFNGNCKSLIFQEWISHSKQQHDTETIVALQQLLQVLSSDAAGMLIAASDADMAGRRHASRLAALATEAAVRFAAILPPDGLNDWNDALRALTPAL